MEKEILIVSFGTSYTNSREKTIGAIEKAIERAYGAEYIIKRAFTSKIIIEKLKKRDNIVIQNVSEAIEEAKNIGVKTLLVQPTHLMSGYEYQDVLEEVNKYKEDFEQIKIGRPLLDMNEDYELVSAALEDAMKNYDREDTALCFMGHGTTAEANRVYEKLQKLFWEKGKENVFIATVEAKPSFEDVVEMVDKKGFKHAVLHPLMIVAGDHANNDMAGDEKDSWESLFEAKGIGVECILRGIGEMEAIQNIYVRHTGEMVD